MPIPCPDAAAETVQFPETDTSLVKIKAVLQSARPETIVMETHSQSVERVTQEVVNPACCVECSRDTDINEYCEEDKLRSFFMGELQALTEVSKCQL